MTEAVDRTLADFGQELAMLFGARNVIPLGFLAALARDNEEQINLALFGCLGTKFVSPRPVTMWQRVKRIFPGKHSGPPPVASRLDPTITPSPPPSYEKRGEVLELGIHQVSQPDPGTPSTDQLTSQKEKGLEDHISFGGSAPHEATTAEAENRITEQVGTLTNTIPSQGEPVMSATDSPPLLPPSPSIIPPVIPAGAATPPQPRPTPVPGQISIDRGGVFSLEMVGAFIASAISQRALTRAEVASHVGITREQLATLIDGQGHTATLEDLFRLAAFLRLPGLRVGFLEQPPKS